MPLVWIAALKSQKSNRQKFKNQKPYRHQTAFPEKVSELLSYLHFPLLQIAVLSA
jgi:hypothetical protein